FRDIKNADGTTGIKNGDNPLLQFSSTNWWERSCNPNTSYYFALCGAKGSPSYGADASYPWGVVLGFSL
ncbi:MAG: hypothetical protein RR477_08200, partial [Raoultibacter sp.]